MTQLCIQPKYSSMQHSTTQVMAAQYEAGARMASQKLLRSHQHALIGRAKDSLVASAQYSQCRCLTLQQRQECLKAIEVLEAKITSTIEERDKLHDSLAHSEAEGRSDVKLLDDMDKQIASLLSRASTANLVNIGLRTAIFGLCLALALAGSLSYQNESSVMAPQVICRTVGLFFVASTLPCIAAFFPAAFQMYMDVSDICISIRHWASTIDDSNTPAHQLATQTETLENRIRAFYETHSPTKLKDPGFVSRIANKYSYPGGPEALFATLNKKYA